jgi:hypothetical protein
MQRRRLLLAVAALVVLTSAPSRTAESGHHYLYVAEPGIRNYVEYGGIGVLVYDMDDGHKFIKRIPTFPEVPGKDPENVKGVAAHARTGRLYVSTIKRVAAIDLKSEQIVWSKEYQGGADRLAVSPDGRQHYIPTH